VLKELQLSPRHLPWLCLLVLVTFRLWFSAVLPMTGDEAYFVFWGEHPAGGYYDHPPMVGWWLTGLLAISHSEWFLRLPAMLLPLVLAWCGWWIVRPHGVERARFAAVLILLQPVNVWNVLITTDTPAILFCMLSVSAYIAAIRSRAVTGRALLWHALAGGLLGLGFLGKYFAALLGIAYLVHVLLIRRDANRFLEFAALLVAALPAPVYNLWWNSAHCWVNIVFNFENRNASAGFSLTNLMLYMLSLLYLASPWLLLALWRQRRVIGEVIRKNTEASAVFWVMLVPLSLFALMSLWRSVGLHWLLSFIPLLAVLAAFILPLNALNRLTKWSAVFGGLHLLVIVVIASLPMQLWKTSRLYDGIVMTVRADEVLAKLQPYSKEYLFSMEGYSLAATLAYNARRPFAVFGEGSFYARQDDFETDWRAQNGRNVLILRKNEPNKEAYTPFFDRVDFADFDVQGVRYYLVLGRGFDFPAYREKVLKRVLDRFYHIPAWLPQRGCDFCERYFPLPNEKISDHS
jgi:4-amino-4-deoxy-L-arabinose transferase-like glycosyltransferase